MTEYLYIWMWRYPNGQWRPRVLSGPVGKDLDLDNLRYRVATHNHEDGDEIEHAIFRVPVDGLERVE